MVAVVQIASFLILIELRIAPPALGALPQGSSRSTAATSGLPPPAGGYFTLTPPGQTQTLPSGKACVTMIHPSTWEPRPDNFKRNHVMPDPAVVHASFAARPRAVGGAYDPRWDSWLLPRVDGQFTGTTDEIFQWAACKWGLPDDLIRAIAVRESTWYQYETYPSGRPVIDYGSGDMFSTSTPASVTYCGAVGAYGYDYAQDFGPGICAKTFSIAGVMDWEDPAWGEWPDNQNGTFPFNRNSTAFAVDYLGSELRGCYEGWETWLGDGGTGYSTGDIFGCVGAWYAGDWHSAAADGYISRVKNELAVTRWLDASWPTDKPGCSSTYGCPGPDPIDAISPVTTISCNGSRCTAGAYSGPVTVTLAATDAGGSGVASTHYTTNGSKPTLSSPLYTGAFSLSVTATVKFRSWDGASNVEVVRRRLVTIA
jgi:hypothetical protein